MLQRKMISTSSAKPTPWKTKPYSNKTMVFSNGSGESQYFGTGRPFAPLGHVEIKGFIAEKSEPLLKGCQPQPLCNNLNRPLGMLGVV